MSCPSISLYFNSTITSTFFVPLLPVLPVNFSLRLNNSVVALGSGKSTVAPLALTAGTSL